MEAAFDALGDATRRRILEILAGGEQPAGAVVDALRARQSISQPAVSQHLRVLRDAGLVTVRAEGTRRLYTVNDDGLHVARSWLEHITGPTAFEQSLDALGTEIARGKRKRNQDRSATTPRSAEAG